MSSNYLLVPGVANLTHTAKCNIKLIIAPYAKLAHQMHKISSMDLKAFRFVSK